MIYIDDKVTDITNTIVVYAYIHNWRKYWILASS